MHIRQFQDYIVEFRKKFVFFLWGMTKNCFITLKYMYVIYKNMVKNRF